MVPYSFVSLNTVMSAVGGLKVGLDAIKQGNMISQTLTSQLLFSIP